MKIPEPVAARSRQRSFFAGGLMALSLSIAALGASPANGAPLVDKKLAQFGLEPRLACVKWASGNWPWGGGWKTCIGHKAEFLQHDFHLVVEGPPPEGAIRQVLEEAVAVAAAAAIGTGLAVPSPEPASRVAAGLAAAKVAFIGYLKARGLERLITQYDMRLDHRTFWS